MREVRSQLEKKKCEYIEKNASNASSDTSDVELNSAEEDAVESLRKELLKKRDTNLKSEIRKIQTENTLADKKLNTRVEEELRRMEEAMHIEEKQLKRKQVSIAVLMRIFCAINVQPILLRAHTLTRLLN